MTDDLDSTTLEFLATMQVGSWTTHHGAIIQRSNHSGPETFHVTRDGQEQAAATSNAALRLAEAGTTTW